MNLTLKELLTYSEEEQDRWQNWFASHGDEPLRFPLSGDRMPSLGSMIQHALGTELWFAEHLGGAAITEWWTEPAGAAASLFELGTAAKRKLRQLIEHVPPEEWGRMVELQGGGRSFRVSVRKAVGNALVHEIRHWAQVAIIVRQHGLAPPGDHDLILSRVLE